MSKMYTMIEFAGGGAVAELFFKGFDRNYFKNASDSQKYFFKNEKLNATLKNRFALALNPAAADNILNNRRLAFTLAEVLITLGVIGIVAAMTLPAVINNSRNKQLEAGLKRSYSLISQALDMYQAETGERIMLSSSKLQLKSKLIKYFKIARDCGEGAETSAEAIKKTCIPNYVNIGTTENNS